MCVPLHTRILLDNFYPYPVIFLTFKTTKTYRPAFQEIYGGFFDWKVLRAKILQIKSLWCISESSLLAFHILTRLFQKKYRNKIFSKACASQSSLRHVLSPCYIFLGICFFFFFNKKFLNKHSIFCSAEEKQIIPIPFTLFDCYIENQNTSCFLSIERQAPKADL